MSDVPSVWTGRYGEVVEGSKSLCRASVHLGCGFRFTQCARKPAVFRAVEGYGECGFCRQHDPEAVAKKRADRDAEYQREWAERDAKSAREKQEREALAACKTAIERIAEGHSDPMTLAKDVLALFPSPPLS